MIFRNSLLPMVVAMTSFYSSETFAKLNDIETGLYIGRPLYVYDIFKTEKLIMQQLLPH